MFFSMLFSQLGSGANTPSKGKTLAVEPLESRELLAAAGLVDVGSQPSGALDDKIVYVHGGHGITWNGSSWGYQRPLLLGMVEDLGNQDQLTYFADSLWRAGATVVPLRPIGNQTNEVIVDNDDAGVTFTGAWSNSVSPIYFGDPGDVPYRFASTSPVETATAEYRPNIPEEGFYPVYAWTRSGSDRVDQLYRVNHSGGATEVTINHQRVGNGPVYLGTYHFDSGTDGYVEISNRSNETGVVIADMIRFGNGIGDVTPGGVVSGQPRENEAGLYWAQWHISNAEGISLGEVGTSTVSAPPRYAEFLNREVDGSLSDRVFVSYHSNAFNGGSRGVIGLHNTPNGGATPNQFDLAFELAEEINDDLVAQNGQFEHNWADRGSNITLAASFNYGEINNSSIQNEFDATIIETGFHDNQFDAEMLRDPRVREALARATTQGLIDYFRDLDGVTPDIDAPPAVTQLRAETTNSGEVTLTWTPDAPSSYGGAAASEYVVYASTNGLGFDGGTVIAGGGTTTHTITGLDPSQTYYFKVAAQNAGGQSVGSEVVAAVPNGNASRVLIVNGFDRLDRTLVPTEPFLNGNPVDRVRPRMANSFDYAIQVAEALSDAGSTASIATTSNEMVASGAVALGDYDMVFWILGEESSANDTFDIAEQAAVSNYLGQGGKLFVSGAEIGWDLDNLNNGRSFYNNTLRADYVSDDAGVYSASGVAGSIFEGLDLTFDDGSTFYDVNFPDVIAPLGGAVAALDYAGAAGAGAIQFDGGDDQLVMLGFPFETILSQADRAEVMSRVLDFFGGVTVAPLTQSFFLDNDDGAPTYVETGSWNTSTDPGVGLTTQRFSFVGTAGATATWQTDLPTGGLAEVFVQYDATALRADTTFYSVDSGVDSLTTTVNQQLNDFQWVSLGTVQTQGGTITVTLDSEQSSSSGFATVVADAVRIDLTATVPAIAGDYDNNGTVEQADYDVWASSLGQLAPIGVAADGNGDGVVNLPDYTVWRDNLGATSATASASAPATAAPVAVREAVVIEEAFQAAERLALLRSEAFTVTEGDGASNGSVTSTTASAPASKDAALLIVAAEQPSIGDSEGPASTDLALSESDDGETPTEPSAIDSALESDLDLF